MPANEGDTATLRPKLQLLGPFRLSQSGVKVAMPGRKARALLAFVVLAPTYSASREQLAYLLWTDRGPDQARASLRQSLKELRELPCLSEALAIGRDSVVLDEAGLAVDLHEIRLAATALDLGALAALLEQARGDLLEDFLDISPGFDEWLQAERPRQRDLVLGQALDAIEARGLADMMNTRSILRSLDRLDPVNEAVVRLGMRLDHSVGDSASLHRRYRQLCDLLESEFDALPSEETRGLFHSLAGNRASASAPRARMSQTASAHPPGAVGVDMVPLVMVTPLQTGSGDSSLDALAAFCADDIRVSLSRMRGIHVLAPDDTALPEVLRRSEDALGIYLLSGSLRQFGGEYRANLQLADATSRIILWSDSLRLGESEEAMLDVIVGKAAGAVLPAIDRDLHRRLRNASGEFSDERALYTRARLLIRSGGDLATVQAGVRLLERVIEVNPNHFSARLLLFRMYDTDFWQQVAGHEVRHFRALADRHLEVAAGIEPGHYAVRIRQAWRHLRTGKSGPAQREFEALLAHLSHDADATNGCAMGFCFIGLLDDAERLMQRAFFLNPFPSSDYHADYAVVLALRGEYETAEEHFVVSGETGLMYLAVRIANAAHLENGAERIATSIGRFIANFHQAWQANAEPTLADVLEWAGYTLPLNPAEHMEWLRQGLQRMLEPSWPATRDSGR